jgi:hypothetical protein
MSSSNLTASKLKASKLKSAAFALALIVGGGAVYSLVPQTANQARADEVVVYKSPTCGCCTDWVTHMEQNGFSVKVHDITNVNPIKQEAGLDPALASCHTAFVGGYLIEGHVPAVDVRRLLNEKPEALGLAVPGMPIGSPGMEVAGRENQPYDVVLVRKDGQNQTFNHHN